MGEAKKSYAMVVKPKHFEAEARDLDSVDRRL